MIPADRQSRGFTLVEILVVLVIIGVMVAMAVLSFGDNRAQTVEREAKRLQGLLRLAADEAVIRAVPLGLSVRADGYRFLLRDRAGRQWVPMADDRLFGERDLPPFVRLELVLDDADGLAETEGDDDRPQALIYPTGEATPFQLIVRGEAVRPYWRLESELNGTFSLEQRE